MKLLNTLFIIISLSINQVFCNEIEEKIHGRYERGLIDVSPQKVMDLIKYGDSSMSVPIFDPYNIDNYDLGVVEGDLTILGNLNHVVIQGLSVMTNLNTDHDFWHRKVKLTMTFPCLISTGNYSIDRIRIGSNFQSAYGNYTAIVEDVAVTARLKYDISDSNIVLDGLEINDIESIKIFAVGNHNGKDTGISITRTKDDPETALYFCNHFHITKLITETFGNSLRAILKGKSISQIKTMLG